MDQPVGCRRPWDHARRVGRWGLTGLLVVWGSPWSVTNAWLPLSSPTKAGPLSGRCTRACRTLTSMLMATYILAQPVGPLYNSLLTFDLYNNEKIVGDLAERWEVAPDGKQITFALRQGVKFHDGSDFTCADAKYSLEKLADPKRATPTLVAVMDNVFVSAHLS